MPRYYCDYCDTYLTHDSPSVRKQHNSGYKHKAKIREYYQQVEAQQNQILIDLRIKEHLGQAAAFQHGGAPYNPMMKPPFPILPSPSMPMQWNPQFPMNPAFAPGIRPPPPAYNSIPGAPPMMTPPGSAPFPGQFNGLPGPPAPTMYRQQPTSSALPNMDSLNTNSSQAPEVSD